MRTLFGSPRFRRLVQRVGVTPPDVDDVIQDAALRLWEARAQVDLASNVSAWSGRITENRARDHVRRVRSRREVLNPFDEEHDVPDARPDPEAHAILGSEIALLRRLIDQIDVSRRGVFVEHELLGMPLEDIAARKGIRLETARKRLRLAWKDIERAAARWRAEQRRRGLASAPVLAPLLPAAARSWLQRGVHALRWWHPLAFTGGIGIIAAITLLAASPPPRVFLARLPSIVLPAAPERAAQDPGAGVGTSGRDAPPAGATKAGTATSNRVSTGPTGYSPREDALINQARVSLNVGQSVAARMLLEEHGREFPRGARAAEREALLQRTR